MGVVLCSSFCTNFNHHHKFFIFRFYCCFCFGFLALFITSFLTPFIAKEINQKYYHYDNTNEVSTLKTIFEIFKIFIKFIGILLLCTLALFLPFINIFVYYLAFYYLFHKLLMIDVTSTILDKESFKNFHSDFSPLEFKLALFVFIYSHQYHF